MERRGFLASLLAIPATFSNMVQPINRVSREVILPNELKTGSLKWAEPIRMWPLPANPLSIIFKPKESPNEFVSGFFFDPSGIYPAEQTSEK